MNKLLKRILIAPIRFYQGAISPLLGPSCRFQPTCSSYMIQAIEEWGPLKGLWLGIKRISKCHPWGPWGYDPIPRREEKQSQDEPD